VKLTDEQVMVATGLTERGRFGTAAAKQLEVTEGAFRYRLKRGADTTDGRANQASALDGYEETVRAVQDRPGGGRLDGGPGGAGAPDFTRALVRGAQCKILETQSPQWDLSPLRSRWAYPVHPQTLASAIRPTLV
jgi:hypothetical protein